MKNKLENKEDVRNRLLKMVSLKTKTGNYWSENYTMADFILNGEVDESRSLNLKLPRETLKKYGPKPIHFQGMSKDSQTLMLEQSRAKKR